jgi:hypothetical protein
MRDNAYRLRETDWAGVAARRVYSACAESPAVAVSTSARAPQSERVSIPPGCNRGRMLVEDVSGNGTLACDVQAWWTTPGLRNSAPIAAPIGATVDFTNGVAGTDAGVFRFGPGIGNGMYARADWGGGAGSLRIVWWFWREDGS